MLTREAARAKLISEHKLTRNQASILLRLAETRRSVIFGGIRVRMHVTGYVVRFTIEKVS